MCVHVYALYVHMCVQLRRQARLRREYLYRKSVEDKERSVLERKRKIQDSVTGKHIRVRGGREVGQVWGVRTVFIRCLLNAVYKFSLKWNGSLFAELLASEQDTIRGVQIRAGAVRVYMYGGTYAIIVAHATYT